MTPRSSPASDRIELWRIALDEVGGDLFETLSPDERERADRFHFERDRVAYAAGRTWLRSVLARYLGRPPDSLAFAYGPHEKPWLPGAPELRFNLAHSGGLAVLAVATSLEVGIDVEAIRPISERVAERVFCPAEIAALRRLDGEARVAGFYDAWTRKEAYLKALGSGLATPLADFEVSLGPDEPARLVAVRGMPAEAACWQIVALEVGPGFKAALAARSVGWTADWATPGGFHSDL